MRALTVQAAAKINWTLAITGVNPQGYHLLDTLMQRITLFDSVRIEAAEAGICLACSDPAVPVDSANTAWRAAELFFKEVPGGCRIFIEKRIPAGAGLGGGSADAAAVLLGLNRLFGSPLLQEKLTELALRVGADVPFLLGAGAARAKGIGEILEPVYMPEKVLLCAMQPGHPAATAAVYKAYDSLDGAPGPDTERFLTALQQNDAAALCPFGGNVLTPAAQKLTGAIDPLLDKMRYSGALFYSMTGSGSAVFGVFETEAQAHKASRAFADLWHCVCRTTNKEIVITQEGKE